MTSIKHPNNWLAYAIIETNNTLPLILAKDRDVRFPVHQRLTNDEAKKINVDTA